MPTTQATRSHRTARRFAALAAAAALVATIGGPATAANPSGFKTSQSAMLAAVRPDVTIEPLITVGDRLAGGYRFEALPDGISLMTRGQGRVDLYVNHETSTVPFPYTPAAPTEANSQNDFDNAQLSHLILNQQSGGILQGRMVITSDANYQRFCSNYLATAAEGFDRPIAFMNEEATDVVNRVGKAWPATAVNGSMPEQAGVTVAYDVKSGTARPIYGMGRLNHENTVAVPGFGEIVTLSGDDTFTSDPAQSQVYAYMAANSNAVWNDRGTLYGFVSDIPAINDYYDFPINSAMSVSGHFEAIPRAAALGDQTDLENASDALNVFQFVRIEDIAYDKRPGMSNVVYLVDSGRGATSPGLSPFTSSNGRIWKMVLDPSNPRTVLSLSILIEGDDAPVKTPTEIHQPDNIESTVNSLLFTEDPGSSQQFNPGDAGATTARLWRYDLASGALEVIARVDQSADEGPTDVDAAPAGRLGAWESSGIVDASAAFGPGAFLIDVQAHTLWVEKAPGDDNVAPAGPDFTYKREGGQLLLIRIPGA